MKKVYHISSIKNNRIRVNKKGYCYLNIIPISCNDNPIFRRFWNYYASPNVIEFEAESDEEALLKYELGEYQ